MTEKQSVQESLSFKYIVGLAAPHTWVASILPILLAISISGTKQPDLIIYWVLMLLGCVALQSAVNIFNDYTDFLKGTDTMGDGVEESDSILVYHNLPVEQVKKLGFIFLGVSLILGALPVVRGGIPVLIIGLIGVLAVLLYSAGPLPICSLPMGELVSGGIMGGLIPLACLTVIFQEIHFSFLIHTIPTVLGIALIMMTNNTCDIERDTNVKRYTMSGRLGRKRALVIYRLLLLLWFLSINLIVLVYFLPGNLLLILFAITDLFMLHFFIKQANTTATQSVRPQAMKGIVLLNWVSGLIYCLWIFLSVYMY